jgi:hypothetical protein
VGVCGCVYKIENFRTLSAPSEIASLREAISSSAAFELLNSSANVLSNKKSSNFQPNLESFSRAITFRF